MQSMIAFAGFIHTWLTATAFALGCLGLLKNSNFTFSQIPLGCKLNCFGFKLQATCIIGDCNLSS